MNRYNSLFTPFLVFLLSACASAPTATPTAMPTATKTPIATNTPIPTDTLTPSPTSTATPSPTPAPPPILRVENLIHTVFDDPEVATWALLIVIHPGFDISQLEETTVNIQINGIDHTISGEDAIIQFREGLDKRMGILFDYDEGVFHGSDELNISISVFSNQDNPVVQYEEVLPNYSSTGVFSLPVDRSLLSRDGPLVVFTLDDLLPGEAILSSFGGITKPREFGPGYWIPGIPTDIPHGNAIDIGSLFYDDTNRYQVIFQGIYPMTVMDRSSVDPGDQCSPQYTLDLRLIQDDIPLHVLVDRGARVSLYPLELRFGHLITIPDDIQREAIIEPGTLIGEIGPVGFIEEAQGPCATEVHIEVLACGSHYGSPPDDPRSVKIPFSIFLSPEERDLVCKLFGE